MKVTEHLLSNEPPICKSQSIENIPSNDLQTVDKVNDALMRPFVRLQLSQYFYSLS